MAKAKLLTRLKPVPERIRVGVGDFVQDKIDNFFLETKKYLEDKYGKSPNFEIQIYPLAQDSCDSSNAITTNDRLNYLLYNDRLVAGVIERRTEFNNLEYIFFRNLKDLEFKFP
jgi:hypothetical protein